MSKTIIFIQAEGNAGVTEAEIMIPATVRDLHETFKTHGIDFDKELEAFVDEADSPLPHDAKTTVDGLKHGSRVHVTRCKKIKVTVHYMHHTIDRTFAPGTRVRTVKQWAVRELKLNPTDAGEHVLQLCNSTTQPPTDVALAELVNGRSYDVCFDLVPEKRIEG
ncbi:hypothetical protein UP10_26190 [Bradyrhizobium sp. LTSPM299]|uniref:hypothetical protein n=1 Tax=Bradyrhizobium sp. LTSPM299 TaxID=1619233 RepID=UPI0005CA960A|nr:hypothetical protein [Bradyrhizobium sp. LTSPM299]KJC58422.1 hypothetical protein UP10_26190 [Bradyrhizobium sp. LTSPM299]